MSDFIREFGKSVTVGIMIITIVDLLLPDTNTKKYINLICGLLVVLLLFSPIVKLIKKSDFSFDGLKGKYRTSEESFNISEENKMYSSYFFDAYNFNGGNSN